MEIHQKKAGPDYHRLKTMVKRRKDQKLRLRNFDARHGRIETGAVVIRLQILSTQQNVKNASRTRSPRGRSPSGRMARLPCKDYLKGTCDNSFVKSGTLQSACSTSQKKGCRFGEECSYAHRQVDEQPWVASRKTRMRWFLKRHTVPGKPDAKSLGINSKSTVHSVHATSSKYPGKERTIAWKNRSQTSSSAKSLRYEI